MQTDIQKALAELKDQAIAKVKELGDKLQSNSDATAEQIKKIEERFAEVEKKLQERNLSLPGVEQEKEKFSFQKAYLGILTGDWSEAGFEKDVFTSMRTKKVDAGSGAAGAFLIPEEVSSEIIDLATARMPIMQMGVTRLRGLVGELSIPKVTARPTGQAVGENAAPTAGNVTFDQRIMRPKRVAAYTRVSKRLLRQTRGVAEQIVRDQLAKSIGLKWNQMLINGIGSENEIKGIVNYSGLTSTDAIGTNGGRFRIDKAAEMAMNIDSVDMLTDGAALGYLMHPKVKWGLRRERVAQYSGDTEGMPIMVNSPVMSDAQLVSALNGYKCESTSQMPTTLTKGSSSTCSYVIFGDFSQVWIGEWLGMELKTSEQASDASGNNAWLQDEIWILSQMEADMTLADETGLTKLSDAESNPSLW